MAYFSFLSLAYVGTAFHGWQIQSNRRTVQGDLWSALRSLWPDAPMPQGAGRTDAGVHAMSQGALIQMQKLWEPHRLMSAINAHLPSDVRVRDAQEAPMGFFPRHHAEAKRYVYSIDEGPAENPFLESRRWHLFGQSKIDRGDVAAAAKLLAGTNDYSSFRCKECSSQNPVTTIFDIRIEPKGSGFDLVFEGDRFLMHQVRIMVGTLVEIGKKKIPPECIINILCAKDRRAAGPTAPPDGLCLEKIWYSKVWGIGEPSPWPEKNSGGTGDE
ncbi:MAG: tRNA pseudouridine(38-40) synthase TruA [Holophagales bacterium]|nr:tRNA pseudouridine(38-40) synthase TruA [Holophagales bacterium]